MKEFQQELKGRKATGSRIVLEFVDSSGGLVEFGGCGE